MAENILSNPQFDAIASALEADRGLPAGTLRAVARQESGGNPNALSNKGAQGAYQFIPSTAKAYNVDVTNPWDSMRGAADYLGDNMKKYGKIEAALADYNGGPSQAQAVLKNGNPTYSETQNYVSRIMKNIGNSIIPSANAAESTPQPAQSPQAANPMDDIKTMAASKIQEAKKRGVSDQAIVDGLLKTAPPAIQDVVSRNLKNGVSPAAIVSNMGGPGPSVGDQVVDGAKNLGLGLVRGGRDLIDGPAYLLASAADKLGLTHGEGTRVSDINKDAEAQYQSATPGSVLAGTGRVAGNVIPMALSGGTSAAAKVAAEKSLAQRVATNVGTGAALGALNTKTDDQSMLENAAAGVIGNGVASGLGKVVLGSAARPLGSTIANDAPQLVKTAEQYGLPLSAANIVKSSDPGGFLPSMVKRIANPSSAQVTAADEAIANQVGKGVGVEGANAVDSSLVNASNPFKNFDSMTQGVQIPLSRARLQADLSAALEKYKSSSVTPSPAVIGEIDNLIAKAAPVKGINPAFSPQTIQAWKSDLGRQIDNATPEAQKLFGTARDVLDNKLTTGLTAEQKAAFDAANAQYKNKLALEAMVKKSNDSGHVTPSQMLQASKAVSNDFSKGTAPYQELGSALQHLYGSQGLVAAPAAHNISLLDAGIGMLAPHGLAAVLAKHLAVPVANSTNATVRNVLTGNTGVQRAIGRVGDHTAVLGPALARLYSRAKN